MPTAANGVQRYDLNTRRLLPAFDVPGTLAAGDITADGSFLYLAANDTAGVLRKLNLTTGTYTTLNYSGYAAVDIAILANGTAFYTTTYPGSGRVPLRQLNTANDQFSTRSDKTSINQDAQVAVNAARDTLVLAEPNDSRGPASVYTLARDTFIANVSVGDYLTTARPAVDRHGTLAALTEGSGLRTPAIRSIGSAGFPLLRSYTTGGNGIAFSPVADVMYMGMQPAVAGGPQYIGGYDTRSWAVTSIIPAEDALTTAVPKSSGLGATTMSPDGRYLFLVTATGVRMYDTVADATPSPFTLTGGTLKIQGSAADDQIDLRTDTVNGSTVLQASLNGVLQQFNPQDISKVVATGGAGNDTLVVDAAVGIPLDWNGDGGANALVVNGSAAADTLNLVAGSITGNANLVTCSITYANATNITLAGKDGANTLSASGAPAGATWLVSGGSQDDSIIIGFSKGCVNVDGGSGSNSMTRYGSEAADTLVWTQYNSSTYVHTYQFNEVTNTARLVKVSFFLMGGDDAVTYSPTALFGLIDGGDGNDTLSGGGTAGTRPGEYSTLAGGNGDDRFYTKNGAIQRIEGGPGDDGIIGDTTDIAVDVEHTGSATIKGTMYVDFDRDGIRDANEPALPQTLVYLDSNDNGVRDLEQSIAVGANGAHSFGPFMKGTYVVRAIPEANANGLTPFLPTNARLAVTVDWATASAGNDIGFVPPVNPGEGLIDLSFGTLGSVTRGAVSSEIPRTFLRQSNGRLVVLSELAGVRVAGYTANGAIDTTFGQSSGAYTFEFPSSQRSARGMVLQGDQKIVVIGGAGLASIARLTANGVADTTFGTNGFTSFDVNTVNGSFSSVVILPDGKILALGYASKVGTFTNTAFLARFNIDGTPDVTYGAGGLRIISLGAIAKGDGMKLRLDTAGRPLIAALVAIPGTTPTKYRTVVARVTTGGQVDPAFGTGGIVFVRSPLGDSDSMLDFQVLPDGRMALVGTFAINGTFAGRFAARMLPSGALDATFAASGFYIESGTLSTAGTFRSISATADGRLLLVGYRGVSNATRISIARLNQDGTLDAKFGADLGTPGYSDFFITSISTNSAEGGREGYGAIVLPDGKLMALTRFTNNGASNYGLIRVHSLYSPGGGPTSRLVADAPSLHEGQTTTVRFSDTRLSNGAVPSSPVTYAFDLDNDGRFEIANSLNPLAAAPASLTAHGPAELLIRGRVTVGGVSTIYTAAISVGKALDAGLQLKGNEGSPVTVDGVLFDPAYALQGIFWTVTGPHGFTYRSSALQLSFTPPDDGSYTATLHATNLAGTELTDSTLIQIRNIAPAVFLSGPTSISEGSQYMLNLTASDPGADTITGWRIDWGDGAVEMIAGNPSSVTHLYTDGPLGLVIRAQATDEDGLHQAMTGLTPAGTLDPSFGVSGTTTSAFGSLYVNPTSLLRNPDDSVIVVGETFQNSGRFLLAKYLTNGLLDPSFGTAGSVLTSFQEFGGAVAKAAVLQPDGKIVVVGYSTQDPFPIARYRPDGSLDPTFGTAGRAVLQFGTGDNYPRAVSIDANGNILVAGSAAGVGAAVMRLLPNGTPDPTFGGGDGVVAPTIEDFIFASDLLPLPDGRIIVDGLGPDNQLIMAKYNVDGTPDLSFGDHGLVVDALGFYPSTQSLVRDRAGRFVIGGSALVNGGNYQTMLIRYLPDGSRDSSFGNNGVITSDPTGIAGEYFYDVLIDEDNRILALGSAGHVNPLVMRYLEDGTLDPSFGDGGLLLPMVGSEIIAAGFTSRGDIVTAASRIDKYTIGRILDGGSLNVTVQNVAPTASFTAPASGVIGQPLIFQWSAASDISATDAKAGFAFSLDLNNDGDYTDPGEASGSTSSSLSAVFDAPGSHVVRGRISDCDGGFTDYTSVMVIAEPALLAQLGATYHFSGSWGGQTLSVTAGILHLTQDLLLTHPGISLVIMGTGRVMIDANQHMSGLTIQGAGTLDLRDREVSFGYADSSSIKQIRTHLLNGYNHGDWSGSGIVSSIAIPTGGLGGIAYQADSAGQIRLVYTVAGDTNLDRKVDIRDLYALALHWQTADNLFTDGDVNYDGLVDAADLGIIAGNWQNTLPITLPAPPELSSLTVAPARRTPTRAVSMINI